MRARLPVVTLFVLFFFAALPAAAVAPQGTAFTYQGDLRQNGAPVTGNVDAAFALFDAAVGGAQVGPVLLFTASGSNPLAVSGGIFNVTLDFGPLAFNTLVTDERYLALTINGSTLSPRTKIESSPYALQSRTAELAYAVSNASIGAAQIVSSQVQTRVSGSCGTNESIQAIAQNGSVTCHVDADSGTITGVTAGAGLSGGGTSGSVDLALTNPLHLDGTDANGVISTHNTTTTGLVRAIVGTSDSDSGAAVKGESTSATGGGYGIGGVAASPNASGASGQSTAATGEANGVYGYAVSTQGNGVYGVAAAASGTAWGVRGAAISPDGAGVAGNNYATSGSAYGVLGVSYSTGGSGVYGSGAYNGVYGRGATSGVEGVADADIGVGVRGIGLSETGASVGVSGITYSTGGSGVEGLATNDSGGSVGVYGKAYSSGGAGVYGAGVNGSDGVDAWSGSTGRGLNAYSFANNGVLAQSDSSNAGVAAMRAYNTTGYGLTAEAGNIGVYAHNLSGTPGRDAYLATPSLAGDFYGGVWVHGTLTKSAGTFKIDHPLDPANKYLSHSFVESPDMKNIYDGVATLDARGEAWVELPAYFDALNRDFRYQLTALDQPAPSLFVAQRIDANRFRIAGGAAGQQVSWQVTGTRKDAYAEAHRTPVEEDKAVPDRGRYISPELYGQPEAALLAPDRAADATAIKPMLSPAIASAGLAQPRAKPADKTKPAAKAPTP